MPRLINRSRQELELRRSKARIGAAAFAGVERAGEVYAEILQHEGPYSPENVRAFKIGVAGLLYAARLVEVLRMSRPGSDELLKAQHARDDILQELQAVRADFTSLHTRAAYDMLMRQVTMALGLPRGAQSAR